jgi:phosphoglycerate-specific signal transduction histidine kinase
MSFDVVLGDLSQMQKTFETEGDHISDARDKLNVDAVSTGDGNLDRALAIALDKLATLHDHVATVIDDHATKLRDTHDEYARHEVDGQQLFDQLMQITKDKRPGGGGGGSGW